MLLGVDYYPEQWNIDLMEQDMDTIVEMGCNVIRIAEFSWHMMEKREGQFDFSFFDHVIEEAKKRNLKVSWELLPLRFRHGLQRNIRTFFRNLKEEKNVPLEEDMCIALTVPQCMRIRKKLFVL